MLFAKRRNMVIAYGDEAKAIAAAVEALGGKAYWCAGRDEAAKLLDSLLQSHDIDAFKRFAFDAGGFSFGVSFKK